MTGVLRVRGSAAMPIDPTSVLGQSGAASTAPDPEPRRTSTAGDRRRPMRRALSWLFTIAIVAIMIYAWPARLGGLTRLVIVTGDSMEPTYDYGDLVVARGGGVPAVGDTVVFAVPDGPAEGLLVIHRVLSIDPDGTITTQGDNRDTPDQWPLASDDVVGEPVAHVPKAGLLVWMVRSPFVLACIVVLVVALLMWPRSRPDDDGELDDGELDADDPVALTGAGDDRFERPAFGHELWRLEAPSALTSSASVLTADRVAQRLRPRRIGDADGVELVLAPHVWDLGAPIDETIMAEAEAWVDEQLALAGSR